MAKAGTDCGVDETRSIFETATEDRSDMPLDFSRNFDEDVFDSDGSVDNGYHDDDDAMIEILRGNGYNSKDTFVQSTSTAVCHRINKLVTVKSEPICDWQKHCYNDIGVVDNYPQCVSLLSKEDNKHEVKSEVGLNCSDVPTTETVHQFSGDLKSDNGLMYSSTKIGIGEIPRCTGCKQPIFDQYILKVLDNPWHTRCLKCAECAVPLSKSCYSRENMVYCKEDFFKHYGTKCAACGKGIAPSVIVRKAQEHVYHLECFKCWMCQEKLETGHQFYLLDDQRLVCKKDYEHSKAKDAENENGKRSRTSITSNQLEVLKDAYLISSKPPRTIREKLAAQTGLDMRVVQVWFQNRRAKEKRNNKDRGHHWNGYYSQRLIHDLHAPMHSEKKMNQNAMTMHPNEMNENLDVLPPLTEYNIDQLDSEFCNQHFMTQSDIGDDELESLTDDSMLYMDVEQAEQQRQDFLMTAKSARANNVGHQSTNIGQAMTFQSSQQAQAAMPMLPGLTQSISTPLGNRLVNENDIVSNSSGRSTNSEFSTSPASWIADIEHVTQY